jgi:hypothetical protein
LCNILIEFGIPVKMVRLIKMCLNETYSGVRVRKDLSDVFPIRNDLKQEYVYRIAFQLSFSVCHLVGSRK